MRRSECQVTSPGYPGMYPAHARCRYLLVMSSPDTSGNITFLTMDLHPHSGPHLPPYKYSGFHATIDFSGVVGLPQPPSLTTTHPNPHTLRHTGGEQCDQVFWSNQTREGIFDTSAICPGGQHCCLRFLGQQHDVIQVSLFKYKLGGRSCSSEASIYDGLRGDGGDNLLRKLCGPLSREPRDSSGRFVQQEFFLSSGNTMEMTLYLGHGT
ncbi:hypothetical protein Hamer_G019641, partial [Homarus americanus]